MGGREQTMQRGSEEAFSFGKKKKNSSRKYSGKKEGEKITCVDPECSCFTQQKEKGHTEEPQVQVGCKLSVDKSSIFLESDATGL